MATRKTTTIPKTKERPAIPAAADPDYSTTLDDICNALLDEASAARILELAACGLEQWVSVGAPVTEHTAQDISALRNEMQRLAARLKALWERADTYSLIQTLPLQLTREGSASLPLIWTTVTRYEAMADCGNGLPGSPRFGFFPGPP